MVFCANKVSCLELWILTYSKLIVFIIQPDSLLNSQQLRLLMFDFLIGLNQAGIERYGNHNYWLSWRSNDPVLATTQWDWFNARNYCRKRCMDLVSFETQDEYEYFKNIMSGKKKYIFWLKLFKQTFLQQTFKKPLLLYFYKPLFKCKWNKLYSNQGETDWIYSYCNLVIFSYWGSFHLDFWQTLRLCWLWPGRILS